MAVTERGTGGSAPTRVLIAENHALLAQGLAFALRNAGFDVDVVGAAATEEVLEVVHARRPDVVLAELPPGDGDGAVLLVEQLCAAGSKVLVLAGVSDPVLLARCIEAGAGGLVSKTEHLEHLFDKVVRAARDQRTLTHRERSEILDRLYRHRARQRDRIAPFLRLTVREGDVLEAMMDGKSASEIAQEFFVALATVRTQIRSILQKLDVNSQLAAVALAHRAGWRDRRPERVEAVAV